MRYLTKVIMLVSMLSLGTFTLIGCEQNPTEAESEEEHAVVESGTYTGTITEVNAEENEIYVNADGNELELYFIETTTLTRGEEVVEFTELEAGQNVEVTVEKVGQRLDPVAVKIIE